MEILAETSPLPGLSAAESREMIPRTYLCDSKSREHHSTLNSQEIQMFTGNYRLETVPDDRGPSFTGLPEFHSLLSMSWNIKSIFHFNHDGVASTSPLQKKTRALMRRITKTEFYEGQENVGPDSHPERLIENPQKCSWFISGSIVKMPPKFHFSVEF